MDLGVLLSLPLESVPIRAVLAATAATIFVRLLLRGGLRAPSVRVATALAPATAILAVVLFSGGSFHLPAVMLPVDGADALPIPVRDGYQHFAPIAWPLLVGMWAIVAGTRLGRRALQLRRVRRHAHLALQEGTVDPRVDTIAARLAEELRVPPPAIAVLPRCPGGAVVVGSRRPVVLLAGDLLERLDDEELEGVLAHELAHVRRRDNLVALLLGAVRDLTFFIPGGGWAIRQLHGERELAADQVAVEITERPGALASGLLKVLEVASAPQAHPCAALVPGGVVDRVKLLVEEQPTVSTMRRATESTAVLSVAATAAVVGLVLPTVLTGAERQRDAVALVWSASAVGGDVSTLPAGEARVFDVYRRTSLAPEERVTVAPAQLDEHSAENRRSILHACGGEPGSCPTTPRRVGLGMRPRPDVTIDDELIRNWRAMPFMNSGAVDNGFGIFWLARVEDSSVGRTGAAR